MLRAALLLLLVGHGLIHVLGFASGFGLTTATTFHKPVGHVTGVLWLTAGALFLLAAGLQLGHVRLWALPAAAAILLSQVLIVMWWHDARFGTIANVLLAVPVAVAIASVAPGSADWRFRQLSQEGFTRFSPPALVTEVDLARLPPPVQRYLRVAGVVGKPRVTNMRLTFRGTIAPSRDATLAPFAAEQVSFFDRSTRLFKITGSMKGLPYDALHAFVGTEASMRVKLASMITVVDARGPQMNQSETVTMLNDMCLLAPATLIDPALQWHEPRPDGRVGVTFVREGIRVSALLTFAPTGELVDFVSTDRYQSSDGHTYLSYPWSTPLSHYRDFHGVKLASRGDAVWHEPAGLFTYGQFELIDIRYNVDRL